MFSKPGFSIFFCKCFGFLFGAHIQHHFRWFYVVAVVFGAGGFVCAVGGGWCCDKVGIAKFTLAVSGCCFATSLLLLAPYYWPQALAQVGLTLGFSLYMIVCTRYTVLYAPPELFGSMSGLLFTAVSVFMGVGAGLVDYAAETLAAGRSPPLLQYQAPFLLLGLGAAALGAWLASMASSSMPAQCHRPCGPFLPRA